MCLMWEILQFCKHLYRLGIIGNILHVTNGSTNNLFSLIIKQALLVSRRLHLIVRDIRIYLSRMSHTTIRQSDIVS